MTRCKGDTENELHAEKHSSFSNESYIFGCTEDGPENFVFIKNRYALNLKNPRTYNEKLQWVKLNYRNPILPKLVDKYTVREYIEGRCPEILNNLIWEGFDAREIPWESLPERFVIKVTYGSGFNIICKDKSKLDYADCEKKLNRWFML